MTSHLAQGHSIGYYGPDAVFLGGADFPFPPNGGLIYVCVSGSFSAGAYQSLCALPGADNAVVPGGNFPAYCMINRPMNHVDDGCYDPSLSA
jgi:hypothetical protein